MSQRPEGMEKGISLLFISASSLMEGEEREKSLGGVLQHNQIGIKKKVERERGWRKGGLREERERQDYSA